jgi:hypothetical protein
VTATDGMTRYLVLLGGGSTMKHLVAAALSEPIRSTVWGCTMHTFRSAITRVLLLSAGFAACSSDQPVDPQDQAQEYVLTPEEDKMDLNSVDPKELDLAQLFGFEIKLKNPSEPRPSILDREWTPIQTTVILYRSIVWLYKHDHVDYDNAVYLVLPVVFANIALQNADDELAVRNLELSVQRPQELVDEGILPADREGTVSWPILPTARGSHTTRTARSG